MMSTHQASEQMIGYLYQVRYALSLLLNNDNENHQISIERFDDVAFSQDDTPKQMIQLKHQLVLLLVKVSIIKQLVIMVLLIL